MLSGSWVKFSLNTLWWMKESKNWRNRVCYGAGKNRGAIYGVSHGPNYLFNLQPLVTHLNFPDPGADCCHVIRTSGWQKSGNWVVFCLNRMDFIHVCCSLILRVSPFSVCLNFDDWHTMSGHLRFPGMSPNFWNTYNIYLYRHNMKVRCCFHLTFPM